MSTQSTSLRGLMSHTRIIFGLLPGLGAMIVLRMAIHLYRPDIEDVENRVRHNSFQDLYDCYDFIVIGGGSAGAVVASRLSENPNWKVLLLEAGQDENVLSDVPVLFPVLQTSSIDWQFLTEPSDNYCLSMVEKKCKWPRGKVLGGSSAINAMLYIRGNKRDYDNWESMGNIGWRYSEVLKYFLKSEDIRIPEFLDDSYHAVGGPLTVENFAFEQPITRKILEAAEQLGYAIRDVNGEFQTGFTRSQATLRDGLRCSTAKGFLRPAAKRQNLHISINSIVEKILIDENKTAYVIGMGSLIDFSINKKGPLYSMMEAEAMAFIKTKYQNPDDDYPDIQLFIAPTADNMDGGLFGKRANGLNDDTYAELYEEILYDSSFSVVPLLLRPKSRGYLKLRDANPFSPPLIYPNYYSDPQDMQVLIEGARFVQELIQQPALRALNARPNPHRNPGCEQHELMSDEHLECQARHHTLTIYHPVGTCAMGPPEDKGAVVDPRLRVYGIKNLRVVDGSIMPTIVSGNTNAPIIMIAEKSSDMIKEDWNENNSEQTCPAQNTHYKESEVFVGDEPTKIDLKSVLPDLFNETVSFFPHLDDGTVAQAIKSHNNGKSLLKNKKGNDLRTKTLNLDTKQGTRSMLPSKSTVVGVRNPPRVPQDPLRKYLYSPQNIRDRIHAYGQNFLTSSGNILNNLTNRKQFHPYFRLQPRRKIYRNMLTDRYPMGYYNNNRNGVKDPSYYYETGEIITATGQKQCKIWLYHDGEKFEHSVSWSLATDLYTPVVEQAVKRVQDVVGLRPRINE
ncbi:unnamed protein product [Arctia plantaginis]|uniref:Glucose-methanol-choline oxidoreductase N-terminal domain-containing protein n=1 Tax=Arctia plantaginis TaxID=874455 RepID=A0A8S1ANZ9_ARCPL|nr:unnamed protein product [Arctia plantaginis]